MTEQPLPEGTDQIIEGAGMGDEIDLPGDVGTSASFGSTGSSSGAGATGAGTAGTGGDAGEAGARGSLFEKFDELKAQGVDRAREYAVQGKERATGALDDLIRMVNDAAEQIDSKVGTQYGDYARRAVEGLSGFNDAVKEKDVDQLFGEAREMVAKAPAVAVGTAAALGFVIARLAKAGIAEAGATGSDPTDKTR